MSDSPEELKRMDREARTGRKACCGYWARDSYKPGHGEWVCDEDACESEDCDPRNCPRNESDDSLYNSPART